MPDAVSRAWTSGGTARAGRRAGFGRGSGDTARDRGSRRWPPRRPSRRPPPRRRREARAASRSPPPPPAPRRARRGSRAGWGSPRCRGRRRAGRAPRRRRRRAPRSVEAAGFPRGSAPPRAPSRRAQHPVRDDAADLARRERLVERRHARPRPGEGNQVARRACSAPPRRPPARPRRSTPGRGTACRSWDGRAPRARAQRRPPTAPAHGRRMSSTSAPLRRQQLGELLRGQVGGTQLAKP